MVAHWDVEACHVDEAGLCYISQQAGNSLLRNVCVDLDNDLADGFASDRAKELLPGAQR